MIFSGIRPRSNPRWGFSSADGATFSFDADELASGFFFFLLSASNSDFRLVLLFTLFSYSLIKSGHSRFSSGSHVFSDLEFF